MRAGKRNLVLVAVAALVAVIVMLRGHHDALAQTDFMATSPGELAKSHSALDNQSDCGKCHVNNSREVSPELCLGCHDHNDLKKNIDAGKGFHASAGVKGKKCESCHKEHKGKSYDLMGWSNLKGGQKGFDHDLTGWPLKGKHYNTDCEKCHKATDKQGLRTFMGTDKLCGSSGCHLNDQPHKFTADEKSLLACERCHTESVWKPAKSTLNFNHDDRKDAAMPILGSHRDLTCAKCHVKSVFNLPANPPDACGNSGCHTSSHDGHLFGTKKCEWCHSPTFKNFKQQYNTDMPFFDHKERTRFELGAHKKLKCYDCHTKALGEAKPQPNCEVCHAKDNRHGNRFKEFGSPPKCNTCHPTASWKQRIFDHNKTKFPLTGLHAQVTCRACHRGKGPADFEDFNGDTACMDCHEHSSVHDKKYNSKQCLQCHIGPGKKEIDRKKTQALYHGPDSNFPLVKAHKDVACEDCHTGRSKGGKTTFEAESAECGDRCHEDSLHQGELGKKCTPCHTSGTWAALVFKHNVPEYPDGEPGFELKGAHLDNQCEGCHTKARKFKDTPRNCSDEGCHADDDAHKGRLGKECQKCHVETGDNLFNHNTMSAFHLDGKHLNVRCADCHPSVTFRPRPTTCFGCHPEPAVHKGQYGTGCEQCHSTRTWDDIKPLHDVGDFSLRGAHNNIACERCHRDNRPLAGSGNLCINCHRQDDIHNNSLSPRCGECHTQWSFTPARFDHSRVGCNLTGLHRTLACFDCHKNGNFSGLVAECASCHTKDVPVSGTHDNDGRRTHCGDSGCHNPNTWVFNHGAGRESICR